MWQQITEAMQIRNRKVRTEMVKKKNRPEWEKREQSLFTFIHRSQIPRNPPLGDSYLRKHIDNETANISMNWHATKQLTA